VRIGKRYCTSACQRAGVVERRRAALRALREDWPSLPPRVRESLCVLGLVPSNFAWGLAP
jgi:hypothetical protein